MIRHIIRVWILGPLLMWWIIALLISGFSPSGDVEDSFRDFDKQVRAATDRLGILAVQNKGRIKPLDSFAREQLFDIFGERTYAGLSPTLVILSWALCPDYWSDKPIIKLQSGAAAELFGHDVSISATHISPDQLSEKLNARGGAAMTGVKPREMRKLQRRLMRFRALARDLRLLPRSGPDGWIPLGAEASFEKDGARAAYDALSASLQNHDVAEYIEAAKGLADAVPSAESNLYSPRWRLALELYYERIGPFWLLAVIYLAITLIYSLGYIANNCKLVRVASVALYPTAAFHLLAIGARGIIAKKMMASNSYEYILVMAAVTAIASLVLMVRLKQPLCGLIGSALCGVGLGRTFLSPLSEAISQLPPVLKSEWMTYHVGAAVLSYGVLYLAFGASIAFLLVDGNRHSELRSMLFKVNLKLIRLGFLLLGIGIITGAIWADKAWGRYWGWDPKESWSLITWLIYGIFLHLRYCLPAKRSRTMLVVVSIVAFIAVLFTFLGVNYILSGLHSYG